MSKKSIIWLVVAIIIVVLVIVFSGNKKQASGEPIKIGAVLSMTGDAAAYGEIAKKGIDLAVEEINAKGGASGHPLEVVIEDDHTDPKVAVSAFTKLTTVDKVDAVIGSMWDFTTQPLLPLATSSGVVLISPTNFRIPGSFDLNENSFVLLPDFSAVLSQLKPYLATSGAKKVAVVHYASGFGAEITKTIGGIMQELGGEVMDNPYTQFGNEFRTTVLKLREAKVDTVFLDTLDFDTINFLTRSKELGFKPQIITHVLILDALKNADIDKSLLENVVVLNWEAISPEFIKVYQAKYNSLPEKSVDKSYDAVYILAEALAKSKDKVGVADYIVSHSFKTTAGETVFTPEHSVKNTLVKIEKIIGGTLQDIK